MYETWRQSSAVSFLRTGLRSASKFDQGKNQEFLFYEGLSGCQSRSRRGKGAKIIFHYQIERKKENKERGKERMKNKNKY
jgi:hypothetical protein